MENRPPQQEAPRQPPSNSGRKPNNSGGTPTPPWLWLLLLGGFAIIFWQFVPKTEVTVGYYPWFHEQVEKDNVKSISILGTEIRGELRKETPYQSAPSTPPATVKRFITYAPSEPSIEPLVQKLIKNNEKKNAEQTAEQKKASDPVRIDPQPPASANSLVWMMLFLPAFVILGFLYLFMRRARDQFDGGILGSFVKSPAKRHDKSKQRTTFDEVAGLENAKSELQEIVEFLKNPEKFQRLGGAYPRACF